MDVRNQYLFQYYDEVEAIDFYREIFPKGQLQQKGVRGDMKYNGIAIEVLPSGSKKNVKRYTITDDLDMINELVTHDNFILLSPISYVGKSRTSENARFIHALAFDLDGVDTEQNMQDLFQQIDVAEYLPKPTFMVTSGNGLHLYYVFENPLPCFKNIMEQLARLKYNLTKKIWNIYVTTQAENVQFQSVFQGFRLVGGVTKNGSRVKAYRTGKRISIDLLNAYVDESSRLTTYSYKSNLSRGEARKKYPDWYERRVEKRLPKSSWTCNAELYNWWLRRLQEEIIEGHRYYGVMCLAIYARKCGIPKDVLEQDAFDLVQKLDLLTTDEHNHFTRADVLSALEMYNDNYVTFPIKTISQLTGVQITRNKRNGRKRDQHVKMLNAMRVMRRDVLGEDEYKNNGRPKAEPIVKAYLEQHSKATKAEVIRATGLSKPTVYKYFKEICCENQIRIRV